MIGTGGLPSRESVRAKESMVHFSDLLSPLRGVRGSQPELDQAEQLSSSHEYSPPSLPGAPLQADLPYPLDPHEVYIVPVQPGYEAKNGSVNQRYYLFNGMQMDQQTIYEAAVEAMKVHGRPIIVVPNDKEESFAKGLVNGVLATVGKEQGIAAEPEAVHSGLNMLFTELESPETHSTILSFSQANLILKTIFEEFRDQVSTVCKSLPPEEARTFQEKSLELLNERLLLRRTGSPYNLAPPGVRSVQMQHPGDPVGMLGRVLTFKDAVGHILRGEDFSLSEKTVVKPRGFMKPLEKHSFKNYMQNNPLFFVASVRDFSPEQQAQMLVESIRTPEYSEHQYNKIVREFLNPSDQVNGLLDTLKGRLDADGKERFVAKLLTLAPDGVVGRNQFSQETMSVLRKVQKEGFPRPEKTARFSPEDKLPPGSRKRY